MSHISGQ